MSFTDTSTTATSGTGIPGAQDPLIAAIIGKLPATNANFPKHTREDWLEILAHSLDLVYHAVAPLTVSTAPATPAAPAATASGTNGSSNGTAATDPSDPSTAAPDPSDPSAPTS